MTAPGGTRRGRPGLPVTPRALPLLVPFVASAALLAAAPSPVPSAERPPEATYWLEVKPATTAEAALHAAAVGSDPTSRAAQLRTLADAHPKTAVAGVARLAGGLALLDVGRPDAAEPFLQHPDVTGSALADHAAFGLGRIYESRRQYVQAGLAFLKAADVTPSSALVCPSLFRAVENLRPAGEFERCLEALARAEKACVDQVPRVLLLRAMVQEAKKDDAAAARTYDRLENEYAASPLAREATKKLARLAPLLPARTPAEKTARTLRRALDLFDAERYPDAASVLRGLLTRELSAGETNLVRVRLGRALLEAGKDREAEAHLLAVGKGSAHEAEAAFALARIRTRKAKTPDAYATVVTRFPDSAWAEDALLESGNFWQKDLKEAEALPYYERLLRDYPDGRQADQATWRLSWTYWRQKRPKEAVDVLERTLRARPSSRYTAGFLYWAGRCRLALGETEAARKHFQDAIVRYKNTYHGSRAAHALAGLPRSASPLPPSVGAAPTPPEAEIPEPNLTRLRRLILADRLDEASAELRLLPASPTVLGTIAWIDWRRGRLRAAITTMKRAYPEHVSAVGDQLPPAVWRILYPIEYQQELVEQAKSEGVDPALVAALICQESTFQEGATSPVGARGLMQVMPATGRELARKLGIRLGPSSLHDPKVSLRLGTRYLRQMVEGFGGKVERALAAYNAGPGRVGSWTSAWPDLDAEEFVESIPYQETRYYVMTILTSREQYRRVYGLATPAAQAAGPAPAAAARRTR